MNYTKIILVGFLLTIATLTSCKKTTMDKEEISKTTTSNISDKVPEDFFSETEVPDNPNGLIQINNTSAPPSGGVSDPNNGDVELILGNQLVNPYTIQNMQNAFNIFYGGNAPTITATHKYVKFKPNSSEQFETLEDMQDLELQDYPMDYQVLQDGDYYQDPSLGVEEIGWLYAVVPNNYIPPVGITYEIICELHLTQNSFLEGLAENLAEGNTYSYLVKGDGTIKITRDDNGVSIEMRPPTPCSVDPCGSHCPYEPGGPCTGGTGPSPTPIPNSGIYVEEEKACLTTTNTVPLRQASVVCKRWFKIWRGNTNDNGRFTVTTNFRNNVKIIIKTKNTFSKVCKVRGLRFWQMLFPCKKKLGVINSNDLAAFRYVFTKPANASASSKDLAYWAATTTHNSVIEFREYSAQLGLPNPPDNLKIMVTNWGFQRDAGAAPMWNKCHSNIVPTVFVGFFVATSSYVTAGATILANTLKNQMDVIIGYASSDYTCQLTSSYVKSMVYHELGHAQHFTQVGCGFWTDYRNAIVTELSKFNQPDVHPYGTGGDISTAPILAIGEMWGNHVEKIYADRYFGNGGTASNQFTSLLQGQLFGNNMTVTPNLNANLWAIENFNPNRVQDVHRWIPQGLPYDLFDNINEFPTPNINDNANGYTIIQVFNALQPSIVSIPAFRDRLLVNSGNTQQLEVNQLFQQYGY